MRNIYSRGRALVYPLLVVAVIAVITFAGVGTASLMGWLPSAQSAKSDSAKPEAALREGAPSNRTSATAPRATRRCADCGTIQAVRAVSAGGSSDGLGAVAGGLVGGLIGSQVGSGNGKTLATIAGAGGGAYVGDQIEKRSNQRVHYQVAVRMDDGSERSFRETESRWHAGDRVRVADGRLAVLTP